MARKAQSKDNAANLAADADASIPRISLGETGFTGLRVTNKQIVEESNRVFRYPSTLKVVSEMKVDPTVAAALNIYKIMIGRVKWTVKPPEDATDKEIARAKFVESCMDDMDSTWNNFISEVTSYLPYGFAVIEKVMRRRLKRNGSKFNDGLVGLAKLAPRGQDTIKNWYFSPDGREFLGVGQSIANLENSYRYVNVTNAEDGLVTIPREKFLLFCADSEKDNPQGRSILKSVYLPYKQLTLLKDQLMLGVSKDLQGIPKVGMPVKYFDTNASAEDRAVYQGFKDIVDGLAAGTRSGIMYPLIFDEISKQPLFSVDLLEAKGGKAFDIPGIIKSLQNDILTALNVDIIKLGSDSKGSFSLADSKENLLAMALEFRLQEIRAVLNKDLMVDLFRRNGWDIERLPTFEFGDLVDIDTEAFSKLIQRCASVGLVNADKDIINKVREVIGVPIIPEDQEIDRDTLIGSTSRSGDGMAAGKSGNGTSDIGGDSNKQDASAANADNKA
jgi:hypothetical protein